MAIAGLGTDLVRTARFRRYLEEEKSSLFERLFTSGERSYAMQKRDPAQHLAARFAAKEACLKAFGLGLRDGIRWLDMEVVPDALGRPELHLSGRAAEIAADLYVATVHLSYSHDGDYAVATVVLEKV
ncbi:MAG: holo-ACP synthase [Desulfuromonadales bacterium]|jgi:holo-[acyl-carrier protein] synthase|nr:holo-ACP synthase [Desulfuromonadales bacterium]